MKINEIIKSCFYILDKSNLASDFEKLRVLYERYMYAIEHNITDDYDNAGGMVIPNDLSINNTRSAYEIKLNTLESGESVFFKLKLLVNKVLKLISTNYYPAYHLENIVISDGYYDLNNLTYEFLSIRKLKRSNKNATFKIIKNILYAENGTYEIEYNHKVGDYDYFDEVNDFPLNLTEEFVVDGVLGEYFILNGFYDEANFYISRFENQMRALNKTTCEKRLKERVWA